MTKDELTTIIARREAAKRNYRKRKTFENPGASLLVTKTRRGVRLTIHQRDRAVYAQITLTPADVERLVRRVESINGGRVAMRRHR